MTEQTEPGGTPGWSWCRWNTGRQMRYFESQCYQIEVTVSMLVTSVVEANDTDGRGVMMKKACWLMCDAS